MIKLKEFVYQLVIEFCNARGKRTFTLQEFYYAHEDDFKQYKPDNHHLLPKVRQQLQLLRDDGLIQFLDGRGTYTLKGIELLKGEVEDEKVQEISLQTPEKREYLIETYARNRGWVKEAKEKLGFYCLYPKCQNTFKKPNNEPYIEVHHIISLCESGEDAIWNLSVICAHHHKMAHFADSMTRQGLKTILLYEVEARMA